MRQRPGGKQLSVLRRAPNPSVEAAPPPVLSPSHEFGAERVPLDVSRHHVEVLVVFNRKRLEPALIKMPRPGGAAMSVPTLGVREASANPQTENSSPSVRATRPDANDSASDNTRGGASPSARRLRAALSRRPRSRRRLRRWASAHSPDSGRDTRTLRQRRGWVDP